MRRVLALTLAVFSVLLLLPVPAHALTSYVKYAQIRKDGNGKLYAITRFGAVRVGWDGNVQGIKWRPDRSALWGRGMQAEQQHVVNGLNLSAGDSTRIYITPDIDVDEEDRLAVVTLHRVDGFHASVYTYSDLQLLDEIDLQHLYEQVYGHSPLFNGNEELNISSAALDPQGRLILQACFEVGQGTSMELGIWEDGNWLALKGSEMSHRENPYPYYSGYPDSRYLTRYTFGPQGQLLISESYWLHSFYEPDQEQGYRLLSSRHANEYIDATRPMALAGFALNIVLYLGVPLGLAVLFVMWDTRRQRARADSVNP